MTLSMEKWVGKVAIVTGASAGIGVSIAEKLVEHGVQVVGLARRKALMEEHKNRWKSKKGSFHPVQCDIRKESDILNAFDWIKKNLGPVSVLINNAGIVGATTLINGDAAIWKDILDTNVLGLCIATKEAINHMREGKIDGHIIHINSIAGFMIPFHPNSNVYPASKHAVTALVETLRRELNLIKSKIKISDISPGLVNSEIADVLPSDSFLAKAIANPTNLRPEDIADAVIYILSTPPHVQIHELVIKPVNEAW
ncbi:farnesol dehydrogenase-like [Sitophilus oryzae]|uniref:Farnesol dehydrogenase-like n=1 Tax=Sitophilus oryzae TaxID=7048 RepID=A0A6J2X4W0_SITOR|nr:farnesol dehydrogenase-like [Sitophilus oryzae]